MDKAFSEKRVSIALATVSTSGSRSNRMTLIGAEYPDCTCFRQARISLATRLATVV